MFDINELPYHQFREMGIDKKAVQGLNPIHLNSLLRGNRTGPFYFTNVTLDNGIVLPEIRASMSIERGADGQAVLKLHTPLQNMPTTVQGVELSKDQIDVLKNSSNPILPFKVIENNGKEKEYLVQYDRFNNDLHVRPIEPAPEFINGHKLSEQQKEAFQKGQNIETPEGNIRKDFNEPFGYKANFLFLGAIAVLTGPLTLALVTASYLAIRSLDTAASLDLSAARREEANVPYRLVENATVVDYITKLEARVKELSEPSTISSLNAKEIKELETLKTNITALKEDRGQGVTRSAGDGHEVNNQRTKENAVASGIVENRAVEQVITPAQPIPTQAQRAQLRISQLS